MEEDGEDVERRNIAELEREVAKGAQASDEKVVELFGGIVSDLSLRMQRRCAKQPQSAAEEASRNTQKEGLRAQVSTWLGALEEPRRTEMAARLAYASVTLERGGDLGWAVLAHARLGVEKARALEVATDTFNADEGRSQHEQAEKIAREADACLEAEARRDGNDVIKIARHVARIHLVTGLGAMRIAQSVKAIDDARTRFAVEATAAAASFERDGWEGEWAWGDNKGKDWRACDENVNSDDVEELWLRIVTTAQGAQDEAALVLSMAPLTQAAAAGEPIARRCARLVEVARHKRRNSAALNEALRALGRARTQTDEYAGHLMP